MSVVELDPDRLEQLAARLERDAEAARRIRHQLAGLSTPAADRGLVERASALAGEMDQAADGTALLARRIVSDTTGADRFTLRPGPVPFPRGRFGWWFLLHHNDALTAVDWDSIEDPADLRAMLEALVDRHGIDAWDLIPEDARTRLIETCPELVDELIVRPGGVISALERGGLLEALAVDETSDEYSGSVNARIPWKLDILANLGLGLTVVERTDGKVFVTVTGDLGGGVGLSTKNKDKGTSGSIDGTVGVTDSITFEFDSMEEAQAALDDLSKAAMSGVSELTKPLKPWERVVKAVPGGDLVVGATRAFDALTTDTVQETLSRYGRHIDRVDSEVTVSNEFAGSIKLPSLGKLSVEAETNVSFYTSTDVHGKDHYAGVKVGVEVSGSATSAFSAFAGGSGVNVTGSARASQSIDYRVGADRKHRLIVKINGEAAGSLDRGLQTAPRSGAVGPGTNTSPSVGVEHSKETGRAASLVIDVPIDESTIDAADDLVNAMLNDEDPGPALEALYAKADITVTVENTATTSTGANAGPLGGAEVSHQQQTTNEVRRKRPHGDWHSPLDIIDRLDD